MENRNGRLHWLIWLSLLPTMIIPHGLTAQRYSFEGEPIAYQTTPVRDAVALLKEKLESGESELSFDSQHGYLKSLLDQLDIPVSSQTLVFSRTSQQVHKISPGKPRALYFNERVYLGFVQDGGMLELAATDPQQGAVFYSLSQQSAARPAIIRDTGQCLSCHASPRTQQVPGYLIRSVFPGPSGHPHFGSGSFDTGPHSPFRERWGGWYVTGTHGQMRHMGNRVFEKDERDGLDQGANRTHLQGLVSTTPYLSPHSDIVALMVLEHQTQMHNAITFANFETRQALHQSRTMNVLFDAIPSSFPKHRIVASRLRRNA